SSRNVFLTPAQRRAAPALYRALMAGRAAIRAGARDRATVERIMRAALRRERSMRLDYLAVCDAETLEPAKRVRGTLVLLGAARLGRIRLIDNLTVKSRR
ncbi:MAG TPA: pantoate--beta-alanine ligase, partial [Nitrospirales bacterium]|nr:pantoate--beta-alanine ligase [Nitrospirales bacterium]